MSAESSRLLRLAEKISDGRPVDWEDAESHSGGLHELLLVRRLRVVSSIAATNRRSADAAKSGEPEKTRACSVRSPSARH